MSAHVFILALNVYQCDGELTSPVRCLVQMWWLGRSVDSTGASLSRLPFFSRGELQRVGGDDPCKLSHTLSDRVMRNLQMHVLDKKPDRQRSQASLQNGGFKHSPCVCLML